MANISGTNLAAPIVPFTTDDFYPTHEAKYGKGGWREVASIAERDAIPDARLEQGMSVFVTGENKLYVLTALDLAADPQVKTWTQFESGRVDDVQVGNTSVVVNKVAMLGTMASESKDDYLPLSGGTVTGTLTVQGDHRSNPNIVLQSTTYPNSTKYKLFWQSSNTALFESDINNTSGTFRYYFSAGNCSFSALNAGNRTLGASGYEWTNVYTTKLNNGSDIIVPNIEGTMAVQVSTIPTADATYEGQIYQFTGTTDSTYTNGYFYKCVGGSEITGITISPATQSSTVLTWSVSDFNDFLDYYCEYTHIDNKSDIAKIIIEYQDGFMFGVFAYNSSDVQIGNNLVDSFQLENEYNVGNLSNLIDGDQVTITPTTSTIYNWEQTNTQDKELPELTGGGGYLYKDGTQILSWSSKPLENYATGQSSLAVGPGSLAQGPNSTALGVSAQSGSSQYAISIGDNAYVRNKGGLAIGAGATTNANYAIQLGNRYGSGTNQRHINADANTFKVGNQNGNFEIMSADGTIPEARLADTTSATQNQILKLDSNLNAEWTNLSASDIPSLTLSKISDVTATATELNYSSGVTSNIQTQLNAKAADAGVVHTTGNETINGTKTFNETLQLKSNLSFRSYGSNDSGRLQFRAQPSDNVIRGTVAITDGYTTAGSGYNGFVAQMVARSGITSSDPFNTMRVSNKGIEYIKEANDGTVTGQYVVVDDNGIVPSDRLATLGSTGQVLTKTASGQSWQTIDALPSQTGQSGKYLTTNGTAASWATISTTLSGLTDVTITTPTSGQVLSYNGTDWENSALPPVMVITDYTA